MEQFEQNLPSEESIEDGKAVLIREKTLYHGTGIEDIEQFQPAEETTIGEGVYLTSQRELLAITSTSRTLATAPPAVGLRIR